MLALTIITIVPLNYAQNSKADSLSNAEQVNKQTSKPATAGTRRNINKTIDNKCKKDSLDLSRCFENGFLYKKNSLSNI